MNIQAIIEGNLTKVVEFSINNKSRVLTLKGLARKRQVFIFGLLTFCKFF
jgi:hypothetical protein